MILTIQGNSYPEQVIAEPFKIEGSEEKFAVHKGLGWHQDLFVTTHVETGLKFAEGSTIQEAIENGKLVWQSKTPEQIAEAKRRAVDPSLKRVVVA